MLALRAVVPGAAGRALGVPDGRRSGSAARDGAFAVGHTRPTVERAARRATNGSDIGPDQGATRDERNATVGFLPGPLARASEPTLARVGRAWRRGPRPGRARWSPKQV